MKASAMPADTPSRAARARPVAERPAATARHATRVTTAEHSSHPRRSPAAELCSPGDATIRNTESPPKTSTTAPHSPTEIGSRYQADARMRANSSEVVIRGWTTTNDPRWRAAACRAKPMMSAPSPTTQIGRCMRRTMRPGRPASSAGSPIAARCWTTTPLPNTKAERRARRTITVDASGALRAVDDLDLGEPVEAPRAVLDADAAPLGPAEGLVRGQGQMGVHPRRPALEPLGDLCRPVGVAAPDRPREAEVGGVGTVDSVVEVAVGDHR